MFSFLSRDNEGFYLFCSILISIRLFDASMSILRTPDRQAYAFPKVSPTGTRGGRQYLVVATCFQRYTKLGVASTLIAYTVGGIGLSHQA